MNGNSDIKYKLFLKNTLGYYQLVTNKTATTIYEAGNSDIGTTKEIVGLAVQIEEQSFSAALSGTYSDTITVTRTAT